MEQISKRDNVFYYGESPCLNAEDAYARFRNDYHESLGKRVYRRLNRIGQRKERIHEFGFVFSEPVKWVNPYDSNPGRTRILLMGLVEGSYCRMLGRWDTDPRLGVDDFEVWFDWAFSAGSGQLRLAGRKEKAGRTSKMIKKRYR